MQTTTIQIGQKTSKVPQSWNDLTLKKQLQCYSIIMAKLYKLFDSRELVPATRLLLATTLLDLSQQQLAAWKEDCERVEGEDGEATFLEELNQVVDATNFLFDIQHQEDGPTLYSISLTLTKCPWSKICVEQKAGKRKYLYAPADELSNITLFEMSLAFTAFEDYITDPTDQKVHKLLAILYRKPKGRTKANLEAEYHGDIRQPIYQHEHMIDRRAEKMRKLPKEVKQLLLFWFASCRQEIIKSYPNVFKQSEKTTGPNYGWGGVMLSLADGIVNLDEVANRPYQDALVYISYLEEQRLQAEANKHFKS